MGRITSLSRHWLLQLRIQLSRFGEHLEGWLLAPEMTRLLLGALKRRALSGRAEAGPKSSIPKQTGMTNLPILYINLDHREDRKNETLAEFSKIGLKGTVRLPAIAEENGALGCAKSHVAALTRLRNTDFTAAIICEDDVEFLVDRTKLDKVVQAFLDSPSLGVLCLVNRVRGPRIRIHNELAVSNNIQMAACYVLKPWALAPLLDSFSISAQGLAGGEPARTHAIDQGWKKLQSRVMLFGVPWAHVARQRESFSDIEKKVKSYG